MKGDFTRWTFDPTEQFTRVLMQQGRVQLDSDWNEQAAILLHYLRCLAVDLIGPFGVPPDPDGSSGDGFNLETVVDKDGNAEKNRFRLRRGRYYVGGLPVENPRDLDYDQTNKVTKLDIGEEGTWLLYLDVWEQFLTHVQDDRIREVALGGPDTAARTRLIWRVRALSTDSATERAFNSPDPRSEVWNAWSSWVEKLRPANRGLLQAHALRDPNDVDPCVAAPNARYTGENQLYRVEIHRGGTAVEGATFKWSRENGSVVFPIQSWTVSGDGKAATVTLEHVGRDRRFGLEKGSWVEVRDDDPEERVRPLLLVDSVEADRRQVTLAGDLGAGVDASRHPYLRRWDQGAGAPADGLRVQEGENVWLDLEDGIQVSFAPAPQPEVDLGSTRLMLLAHLYQPGDYWLIPARSATGDVEWPRGKSLPPLGVEHHFAPLGVLTIDDGVVEVTDCRRTFGFLPPIP